MNTQSKEIKYYQMQDGAYPFREQAKKFWADYQHRASKSEEES